MLVSRKFVSEIGQDTTVLQFGSGQTGLSDVVANPQNVALDVFGKKYITDTSFDPSRISKNETFGTVPSNTELTVAFRTTNPQNSNVAVGGISTISNSLFEFVDRTILVESKINDVIQSLEATNEDPIMGEVAYPSTTEIKSRIYDTFPTQNRAVTQADYENLVYRMPPKFGSIKRCSVQRDPSSQKRNLNMYVISDGTDGKLALCSTVIKKNLKTWINGFRMINDTIDILDPFIIDVGIEFVIKPREGADRYQAFDDSIAALASHFAQPFFIGEPLYISDIYSALKTVDNVLDVTKVKISNKSGGAYSQTSIDIDSNLSPDGSYLMVPKNAILQIKFPEVDITGKVI